MDGWRHISECLESGLMDELAGDQLHCSAAVDPGFDEAVSLGEFTVAGVAPAKREKAAGAAKAPAQSAAH